MLLASTSFSKTIRYEVQQLCASNIFKNQVLTSFKRGKPYIVGIKRIFKKQHLPTILAYLPIIESGFKKNAVSRSGATGPWQFMKYTAIDMNLVVNSRVDERKDLKKSTIAAAKYFTLLNKKFNGDLNLMLAGYNGGPTYIKRNMVSQNKTRFSKLSLYKETSRYIPKFWASVLIIKGNGVCKL